MNWVNDMKKDTLIDLSMPLDLSLPFSFWLGLVPLTFKAIEIYLESLLTEV